MRHVLWQYAGAVAISKCRDETVAATRRCIVIRHLLYDSLAVTDEERFSVAFQRFVNCVT